MSILDLHADTTAAAAPRYVEPPRAPAAPKFSAWSLLTAVPRGVTEAAAQGMASISEVVAGFGDVMGRIEAGQPLTERQPDMSSDFAELLRDRGREFRPHPTEAHAAEQVLYGFARAASKVVAGSVAAGPIGVVGAGLEESISAADDLARQGVGFEARTAAGAVQGAGLALAALPLIGRTIPQTAALYLAGGPGGFVAQQALTREILQAGGYDRVAEQYDPFDPVGLAVSALVPAVFTAAGLRAQRRAATVSREAQDAARVLLQAEQRQTSNPAPEVPRSAEAHEAALVRAEDALARGEQVQVADVAPRITPEQRAANFREWFGDSKVVDAEGKPLVVYHGTARDFDSYDPAAQRSVQADPSAEGLYFTRHADDASGYATGRKGRDGANVQPVYVSLQNPYIWPDDAGPPALVTAAKRAELERAGYDGIIFRAAEEVVAFRPEQIKSAIGNSGRFDPGSPSLTDPLETFGANVRELARVMDETTGASAAPTAQGAAGARAGAAEAPAADGAPAAAARGDGAPAGQPDAAPAGGAVETAGVAAEQSASAPRLAQIRAQFPDLQVQLDGMDAPMRLDDFLAAVKAEADELEADAPLMQVAAECALLNGTR